MPRKARDERLNTRTVRLALKPRREPYWRTIQEGRAIGYRRLAGGKAGAWIARHYDPAEGRRYKALANADDLMEADGASTLTFAQAQTAAVQWFGEIERNDGRVVEPVTVANAMASYIEDYVARGGRALRELRVVTNVHILPALGSKQIDSLTFATIKDWHHNLAKAPARLRTSAKLSGKQKTRKPEPGDHEGLRARRSSANRVLTVLKAALSLAYREGHAASDDAWRRVKPFPKVDAPRIRYLTDSECVRLVNACPSDFRKLVSAALLTGCRYQELTNLRFSDFDAAAAVLHIRRAKAGARTVPLSGEAALFFKQTAAGKAREALLLTRDDGEAWGNSHQVRRLRLTCQASKISPAVSFHILRHTFASRLVMRDVPMPIVAAALGNSVAICTKHYAHLAPDYIANAIRKHAGGLGIVPDSNVTAFEPKAAAG